MQCSTIIDTVEKAERFVKGTAFASIVTVMAEKGPYGFLHMICGMLYDMQDPQNSSFNNDRKFRALLLKLKMAARQKPLETLPGIKIEGGIISFKV